MWNPDSTAFVTFESAGETADLDAARRGNALILRVKEIPGATAHSGTQPGERVIVAHGPQLFAMSELDQHLRANRMSGVILAGGTVAQMLLCAAEGIARGWQVGIASEASELAALAAALFRDRPEPVLLTHAQVQALWPAEQGLTRHWRDEVKSQFLLPTLAERLDPSRTAYVMIDVQNDFTRRSRSANDTFELVDTALPNIDALLRGAREAGCLVVHVQAEYGALFRSVGQPYRYPGAAEGEVVWTASASEFGCNGALLPDDETEVCREGSWGEAFTLATPQPGEIVLRKHRYSGFVDTGLETILRSRGIETVVLTGVATNVCVESTARDASMRDFYTVVVADGVATGDRNRAGHEAALRGLRACFAMVEPAARVIDIWATHAGKAAA